MAGTPASLYLSAARHPFTQRRRRKVEDFTAAVEVFTNQGPHRFGGGEYVCILVVDGT